MSNVVFPMPDMLGVTGMFLFLRSLVDGSLISGSGFALTDAGSTSFFTANVPTDRTGLGTLLAIVSSDSNAANAIRAAYLHESMLLCVDQYAISDALLSKQTQILQAIDNLAPSIGTGEDQVTLTIRQGGLPLADVSVWVTTDAGGQSIVAGSRVTNDLGKVLFLLTNGATYYLWATGHNMKSINGQKFIAEKDL